MTGQILGGVPAVGLVKYRILTLSGAASISAVGRIAALKCSILDFRIPSPTGAYADTAKYER